MRKIPTLFVRDPEDRRYVTDQVTPGCEWVLAGDGVPTRKYDGTCVMFDGQWWWARREVKPEKAEPPGWVQVDADWETGKRVGWEPIEQSPFAKFHAEALDDQRAAYGQTAPDHLPAGTYELVGPKVNGNPEHFTRHALVLHEHATEIYQNQLTPEQVVRSCAELGWEGIVWHHSDGRMAKLKARDFPR